MPGKAFKVWEIIRRPWTWPRRCNSIRKSALLRRGRSLPSCAIAAQCYDEDEDDKDDDTAESLSAPLTPLRAVIAPEGYIAVYVGAHRSRFVIPAEAVNHPRFRHLLDQAEHEYGFDSDGPLTLPCDVGMFRSVLRESVAVPVGRAKMLRP